MATEELADTPPVEKSSIPTSHPIGFYFLFAGEFAERFSYYGMRAILPLYLADQMGYGEATGGYYYAMFMAACYLLPLAGGYVADNYFGKYWTIVGFSLPYVAGHLILGYDNEYLLFSALALLAMGAGVIKPNISTLMGLTYDQYRPGQEKLRSNAFQYFYMSINIGAFLSTLIIPQVRDYTGSYPMAFAVPAVFMIFALGFFAAGKKFYAVEVIDRNRPPEPPEETVAKLRVLGQVGLLFGLVTFFWAVFDQSSYTWVYFARTYMDLNLFGYSLAPDSIQALNPLFIVLIIAGMAVYRSFSGGNGDKAGIPATTKMFVGFMLTAVCMGIMAFAGYQTGDAQPAVMVKCKDAELFLPLSSADVSEGTINFEKGSFDNTGGLMKFPEGTARELAFGTYGTASSGNITFSDGKLVLGDGKTLVFTNGRVDYPKSRELLADGKLELPGVLDFTLRQGDYQLDDGVLTVMRGNELAIKPGEKLAIDLSASTDKSSVSITTGKYVPVEGRVSVWWMALAYFVITVAEILISVTGLELAFVVAPASMKGFITALWLFTVFVANAFINAPIADLYPAMHPGNYFMLLAGIGLLVALVFIPVSRRFNRAMAEAKRQEQARAQSSLEGNSQVD